MSVGGIEISLHAPAGKDLGDMIVRVCRRHWAGERCYFQDAEDADNAHPFDDPWVWTIGTSLKEFFVYQNEAAWRAWDDEGAISTNANTMFHFLIGTPDASHPDMVEICLVCDRLTAEVKRLSSELQKVFVAGVLSSEAA